MASEIRVDKINSLSGVGTVTLSPTGVDISGITTVSTLKVGTGVTASEDGDIFFTGIATATTFVGNLTGDPTGSGANLTALPAGQLTGTVADARISTLTASKLSGALPAISALNLTNVPAANVVGVHTSLNITGSTTTGTAVVGGGVTISESGIEASGIGITCANINGGQIAGRRNLLINGEMKINQRVQTGSLGYFNPVTGSIYTLDRWKVLNANSFDTDSAQVTQDSSGPAGFRNSIQMNIGNTETPSSNQVCGFQQKIEAQDLQGLKFGTSSAETTTLSFWVYSNKTGTYCIQVIHEDVSKYVLFEYTISASNTWEKKTITISGNTSNTITDDNGTGLNVIWVLCAGSGRHVSATSSWTSSGNALATSNQVNLWDDGANYFRMTGCQLEIGTEATAFEHRSFGEELSLCQRYFQNLKAGSAVGSGNNVSIIVPLFCPMRTTPSLGKTSGDFNFGDMVSQGFQSSSSPTIDGGYLNQDLEVTGYIGGFSGPTNYRPYRHEPSGTDNALITASAEL